MRLQTRLTITAAALITAVSLSVGGASTFGAYQREIALASKSLKSDRAQILAANGQELSTALLLSYQQDLTVGLIDSADVLTVVREGQIPISSRPSADQLQEANGSPLKLRDETIGPYLMQSIKLQHNEWMILQQSLSGAQARLNSSLSSLVLYTSIADLMAVALLALLIRRDLRGLRHMIRTARKLANGTQADFKAPAESTEVGELGAALESMVGQLQANQISMQAFLGDASHELRTPLTVIRGYLEMLGNPARSGDAEFTSRAIAKMQAEVHRMQRLIDDLLLLTELGAAGRPLKLEPVDIAAMLRSQLELLQDLQPGRSIQTDIPKSAVIQADRDLLDQLFTNLFGNIRRHTGAAVPVAVKLDTSKDNVSISVSDAGPGLNQQAYSDGINFFERFDPSRSRDNGGSGLGMSIMAGIVAKHQGTMTLAQSDLGGLCTAIQLPVSAL